MELFDAVVVGAGPAGSTLSRTLARNGFRVLLIEKEMPGIRSVCGGFAGPEITDFFSSEGLSSQFTALPKNEIRHVRISSVRSGAVDTAFTNGPGWAVDRPVFDSWLAKEAVLDGVELSTFSTITSAAKTAGLWGITVKGNEKTRTVKSRFLFIATGRRTPRISSDEKIYFACKTVYENSSVPSDRVTLHFIKKGHAGLNPLGNGKTAMCCYVEAPYLKSCKGNLDEMMENLKRVNVHLAEDLRGARRISDWKTCAAEPDRKRIFYREDTFFTGDALTMVNPIIGGGMSIAVASARMLGNLIAKGKSLEFSNEEIASDYEKVWTERFGGRVNLAGALGTAERSGILSGPLLFLMGSVPPVFSRLVQSARKPLAA